MPVSRRKLPAPERSASILAAAARMFAEHGYSRTSVDDIAEAAGITKLIVYRHFDSKRALYLAVLQQVDQAMTALPWTGPDLSDPDAAISSVAARLTALMGVARTHPDAFTLLVRDAQHEPEFADQARKMLARGIPDAEAVLHSVADPAVRRWAVEVIGATVDASMLSWLRLGTAVTDQAMANRLATILAHIGGVAMGD